MNEIHTKAEVKCSDGGIGRSTYIIVNPINQQLTHLVVKSDLPPFHEFVVPVDQVDETTPNLIKLKCTQTELEKMQQFKDQEYIRTVIPDYQSLDDNYLAMPYVIPTPGYIPEEKETYFPVEHENIPEGEIAIKRGARVEATDGYVGQVDELLVNPETMHVTHLVLRDRHIFSRKDITIPISQIDRADEDNIYLKLDRHSVEGLPTTPIQRWAL